MNRISPSFSPDGKRMIPVTAGDDPVGQVIGHRPGDVSEADAYARSHSASLLTGRLPNVATRAQ